ncbi:Gmad2 immunoglobulin-like domain-containing protein [Candidatus Contubernalis alkaliaceticus]|uniref:Gmad2 immunoglobulin-like domain-containing protein n=1 Tax=Candidatus Contubernalis alkaliaceticus TaxID=338645 RepID=UPI001F4BF491|nr:Gmad2 immunoglobulin-like domain-containing protein [Candidatus Contubernalis alkalaceticus]UNC91390.1 protease complex subunit PrcB family protein [Candidatus Contubernalis alkalaceticus]
MNKIPKKYFTVTIFVILALIISLFYAFGRDSDTPPRTTPPDPVNDPYQNDRSAAVDENSFVRVSFEVLPKNLQEWVENSKEMNLTGQEKEQEGNRYILITYGMKQEGYEVKFKEVGVNRDIIEAVVEFTHPKPGQEITDNINYPFDIVYTKPTNLPLVFVPTGDEEHIMSLVGINELRRIAASSPGIKVFTPAPQEQVESTFLVQGVANVFEGTVQYRIKTAKGDAAYNNFTTAGMGDWYFFEIPIDVPSSIINGSDFTIELFSESAKDGSEENLVSLPLNLK